MVVDHAEPVKERALGSIDFITVSRSNFDFLVDTLRRVDKFNTEAMPDILGGIGDQVREALKRVEEEQR